MSRKPQKNCMQSSQGGSCSGQAQARPRQGFHTMLSIGQRGERQWCMQRSSLGGSKPDQQVGGRSLRRQPDMPGGE